MNIERTTGFTIERVLQVSTLHRGLARVTINSLLVASGELGATEHLEKGIEKYSKSPVSFFPLFSDFLNTAGLLFNDKDKNVSFLYPHT